MKKVLAIIILGLFLSSNAYAKKEQKIYHKDENSISMAKKDRKIASKHCAQYKKFAFFFSGGSNDGVKNEKGKGTYLYHCSSRNLRKDPFTGNDRGWTNYDKNAEFAAIEENKQETQKFEGYKATCEALGFKPGSEKFADCALKLFIADNKEAQVVQSSSGTQEVIIRDPDREQRIRLRKFNDRISGKCAWTDWNC